MNDHECCVCKRKQSEDSPRSGLVINGKDYVCSTHVDRFLDLLDRGKSTSQAIKEVKDARHE